MRDIGATRHTAKHQLHTRIGEHSICEGDEGFMHIVFWYGSSDAVQVRRSQAN